MADQPQPDDLAAIRSTVTTMQARLTAQEAEIASLKRRRRTPRRSIALLLAALLVALVPLATLAANPFTDLNPGSPHNGNIEAIFTAGITTGCAPTEYCPNGNLTREEMASFLARTAGLGGNPPVANAATLQGYAPSGLTRVARAVGANPSLGLTGAFAPAATVALNAPGPGFVLVTGTASFFANDATCGCAIRARLRDASGGGGGAVSLAALADIGPAAGSARSQTVALTYVFPVPEAGARSFAYEGLLLSGAGASVINAQITALFVPFGAAGGATLAGADEP